MKRGLILFAVLLALFPLVGAQTLLSCDPSVSLISQDPYPIIPGEYVKLVFQVDGIENADCGMTTFTLIEDYPLSFDAGEQSSKTISAGIFVENYPDFWLVPFKVRVESTALDGDNPIEVELKTKGSVEKFDFTINVEDLRTDFEVSIKDYDYSTNTLTFEILNVGEHDVEAVTVEIESQETISIKGSKRNIIGSLDSNEDTTFTFEAIPKDGPIKLNVVYTDEINERRVVEKQVEYLDSYFSGRARDQKSTPFYLYIIIVVVIIVAIWWWRRRQKKKKQQHHKKHHS